jgi:hypothetical protein
MAKVRVKLPTVLNEDCWFYEDNKELCEPHKGKYYISYSSVNSWGGYRENLIKQKFVGIELQGGVYAELGNYFGEAVENGKFAKENPQGFTGQENLKLVPRPKKAEYEKMILIDMGEYVIIGFIDIYDEVKGVARVGDIKTGGARKEKEYADPKYIQVMLYAHAIEQTGKEIGETYVWFVRRTGSHINPPLHISDEQFKIPLEYTPERVAYALGKVDDTVKELSEYYKAYLKYFK